MTTPRPTTTTTSTTTRTPTSTVRLATTPTSTSTLATNASFLHANIESLLNRTEEAKAKDGPVYIPIDLTSLEQEIMVYESELEPHESRGFRESPDSTAELTVDSESAEMYVNVDETSENDLFAKKRYAGTCEVMERKFENSNDTMSDDAVTHLGAYLQFVQLLYTCCFMRHNDVLISWVQTPARVNNAVSERAVECGNF